MALPALKMSERASDFINDEELAGFLRGPRPDKAQVREIIAKSMNKQALSVRETAMLMNADDPGSTEEIFNAAKELKKSVYGNRIVLFAPLYIGNRCINDCIYCAFRRSNTDVVRRTLDTGEIEKQVTALENQGHKRLILVFGEDSAYDADYIAETVRTVYRVRFRHGEIRRVNINAAPLDYDGYVKVKSAGIGTYQVFQETYHHKTYGHAHPRNTRKGNYLYRLDALSRALEAGCDDVGIGALFGLYDWRFETLGLVSHALYLQERYGVGPHTISFPRLQPAFGIEPVHRYLVSDNDFMRLVAILRLAVPYTGLILTAREKAEIRRAVMAFGVSQIDAGSRIEIGGYTEAGDAQCMEREQFVLGDIRSLDEVMHELVTNGYVPSFCTACYRKGRTGVHFMEFAIPGFIKRFCTPNALTTLMEYLVDYASPRTREAGLRLIGEELAQLSEGTMKDMLIAKLDAIKTCGERDLYF